MSIWSRVQVAFDSICIAATQFLRDLAWSVFAPGRLVDSIRYNRSGAAAEGLRFYAFSCGLAVVSLATLADLDSPIVFGQLRIDFYELMATNLKLLYITAVFSALLIPGLFVARFYSEFLEGLPGARDVAYYALGVAVIALAAGLTATALFGNSYWIAAASLAIPALVSLLLPYQLSKASPHYRRGRDRRDGMLMLVVLTFASQAIAILFSLHRFESRTELEARNITLLIDPTAFARGIEHGQLVLSAETWHNAALVDASRAELQVDYLCLSKGDCTADNASEIPSSTEFTLTAVGETSIALQPGERKFLHFQVRDSAPLRAAPIRPKSPAALKKASTDQTRLSSQFAAEDAPVTADPVPIVEAKRYATHVCLSLRIPYFDHLGRGGTARIDANEVLDRLNDAPTQAVSANCQGLLKAAIKKEVRDRQDQ